MRSLLLTTAIRLLVPVFMLFSFYMFFRGHNQPGGGFIAALVMAIGFLFHMLTWGKEKTRQLYGISTRRLTGLGLIAILASVCPQLLQGDPLLKAYWLEIPLIGKMGTPILFDAGVYLVVVGVVMMIAFSLFED
ncbi:MAG: MnhB domain-containing protein [Cyclobacteriaceae bacterium]